MQLNRMLLIGEKETFIVRVLIKKIQDAGYQCDFATWNINDIYSKWDGKELVTLFMDDNCTPPEDVLHFLSDKVSEYGAKIIVIGDKLDVQFISENVPAESIFKKFVRPIDNNEYVVAVKELMGKIESGEYMKTILVVDDDAGYLALVREWLKGSYKVAMVNSGLQAIKWLGKNKADLILLDHEMPVTSGPQVLEMLRSDEDTKNIPVIFLTGKGDKDSVMAVVALRPEGYFLKTIEKDELLEKLKEFFILHK
ncbi:MAG: response regulator [Lachnospiraceae bacterium]|nr:response regulator [Lachnospiraceae bacterium]